MNRLFSVLTVIALIFTLSSQAQAAKRIALVIGNGAYGSIGALSNPPNDARLMAGTLRPLGFEVIEEIDVDQKSMKKAIKAFGNRLEDAGSEAIGLFYYAGHGVQVDGENFLIPINVEINDEADVDIEAVSMNAVLKNMEFAGNDMNIVIMDSCRNNPFKRGFRSVSRGLARVDAAKGTLLAYATSPGDVAADGSGMNSPYTVALTNNMVKPGLTIERMFKQVRNSVVAATDNAQVPWESSSLVGGDFYFNASPSSNGSTAASQSGVASDEAIFWQSVQNSITAADYEAYLIQYPNGTFAALARVKLGQLNNVITETASRTASASLLSFKPGEYKVKKLPSTDGQCRKIRFSKLTAESNSIEGNWTHPEASGHLVIGLENKMISLRWKGTKIRSNRELVQVDGTSLLFDVTLKHRTGACKIAFKLTDVLAN